MRTPARAPGMSRMAWRLGVGLLLLGSLLAATPVQAQNPPSNLTGVGVSSSQIDLSWGSSGIFATYTVYRNGAPVASGIGATSYSDGGLAAFTSYDYFVTATVFGTESGPSNTITVRTLDGTPPTTPANLQATAASTTQIDITWDPASDPETGILDYVVYRDGGEVARTAATSYSDTGLQPSTVYQYRVSAVNGDGVEGSQAGPVNEKTLDPVPPPAPSGLSATTFSDSEIDLSWTAPSASDLIGYRIYRNGSAVDDIGLTTTYRDSGLDGFTTYNYTVTALDDEGLESDPSNSAQATTLDGTPPTKPDNLTADPASSTSITLSWTASSDPETGVAGYRVFRDGSQIVETTGTTFLDTGLSPATEYEYRVRAVNGQGLESDPSDRARATTLDDTPPSTPTDLTATAAGTDEIDLDWSASSDPETGIQGYRVYRDGSEIAQTVQSSYTDTGLSPATEYTYQVRAVNGQGLESDLSDPATATTLDATPPTIPTNLSASPVGTERIDLTWSASSDPESGIAGYRVFRDGSEVGTTTQTVFQDDGLSPATEYDYYVVAVNGDGLESDASSTVSATTFDGTGPTTPTELTATAAGPTQIDLTWSPSEDPESGIDSYTVFRDGAEVGTTTETFFQDTGLDPATTYEYTVSAVNGDGLQSGLSEPASATTQDGSGPTAPTDLAAEPVSQTQIDLTWTASQDPESGVDRYNVYRDSAPIGSVVGTSFADSGLERNTTYVYSVSAVNGEGIEGERSESVSAKTFPSEDQIPPAPPTGLRVVTP